MPLRNTRHSGGGVMSWEVAQDVRWHAPRTLTTGEKAVLRAIADAVRTGDPARRAKVWHDEIAWIAAVDVDSMTKLIERLVKKGALRRVPLGTDRHGRAQYTTRGTAPIYEVPTFTGDPEKCPCSGHREGRTTVPPSAKKVGPRSTEGGTTVPGRWDGGPPPLSSEEVQESAAPPTPPADRARFKEFLSIYPRRVGKDATKRAEVAWEVALARPGVDDDRVIQATKQYADIRETEIRAAADPIRERRYTPGPDTWLAAEGWRDVEQTIKRRTPPIMDNG